MPASFGIAKSITLPKLANHLAKRTSTHFCHSLFIFQRRVTHHTPVLIRSKVDPDLKKRPQQVIHCLKAVSNRSAVHGTVKRRCTMNQLAPEQINSLEKPVEDQQPVALNEPRSSIVHRLLGLTCSFVSWLLPEISAQELIFENGHHERFVLNQHINDMITFVEIENPLKKPSPTITVCKWFFRLVIPLPI